jgi:ketosteroid isomerase-like protein
VAVAAWHPVHCNGQFWIVTRMAVLLLVACRHSSPAVVDDAAPTLPIAPTAATSTSTAPSTTAPPAKDARVVIEEWNRLHNEHDAEKLASLYAPKVLFYGASLSRADCANKKRVAFAATPDYAQSTRDAKLESAEAGRTFVRLVKTSTTKGKSTNYPTILVIDANGNIMEESDDLPDDWCIDSKVERTLYPVGNDRVVAPFRMSANDAMIRARSSKHFQSLSKPVGDMSVACARRCAIQTHECGFSFTLHDMDRHGVDDPTLTVSSWMGVVEVDPVTKTLWWEDYAADGASTWRSEQL